MTKEAEAKAILLADPTIMAILEGGVYTEEELGVEGIRRGDDVPTSAAFDVEGKLLPCAFIRESGEETYRNVQNPSQGFAAVSQIVVIYFFQMRGSDLVMAAKLRAFEILTGRRLGRSYPIWLMTETAPIPDTGPITNSTTLRQDWMVVSMRQAALA